MKKLLLLLFLGIIFLSCNQKTAQEKIENLNGYWEIKKAQLPNGATKEYTISEFVDYIEITKKKGTRKKVKPKFTGGFLATPTKENFKIKVENDSIHLYYSTPYDSWKETLIFSEKDKIKILNTNGIIYTYKRFTPYLSDHDKKK